MTPIPSTPTRTSHHHSSKPRMLDQTPVTRAVVKTANCIFRVYVATDNGFPTEDEIAAHARASFKRACKDLKQNDILTRFEADAAYAATEAKIVGACLPAVLYFLDTDMIDRWLLGPLRFAASSKARFKMLLLATSGCMACQRPCSKPKLRHSCMSMLTSSKTRTRCVCCQIQWYSDYTEYLSASGFLPTPDIY